MPASPDYLTSGYHGPWYVVATRARAEAALESLRRHWPDGPVMAIELDHEVAAGRGPGVTDSSSLSALEGATVPLLDLRKARQEVSLAEVLTLIGWRASIRRGDQVRGPCPVHGSHGPGSRIFSANLARGCWHCFRCGAGGNALDLYARVSGLPFYEAVLDLFLLLGKDPPHLPQPRTEKRNP